MGGVCYAFVPVCENGSEPELTFTFTYIRLEPELAERPPEKAATPVEKVVPERLLKAVGDLFDLSQVKSSLDR